MDPWIGIQSRIHEKKPKFWLKKWTFINNELNYMDYHMNVCFNYICFMTYDWMNVRFIHDEKQLTYINTYMLWSYGLVLVNVQCVFHITSLSKPIHHYHHIQSQHDLLIETRWTSTKVILQKETLLHHVWHVFNYWRCWLLVRSYQHFTFFMWYMTNYH